MSKKHLMKVPETCRYCRHFQPAIIQGDCRAHPRPALHYEVVRCGFLGLSKATVVAGFSERPAYLSVSGDDTCALWKFDPDSPT
jgi:hypothetical protein